MAAPLSDDAVRRLRAQLDEANETIRQMRADLAPKAVWRYRGLRLSRNEHAILEALYHAKGYLTRQAIRWHVEAARKQFSAQEADACKSVDVEICRLRKKLQGLCPTVAIETVYAQGYYLEAGERAKLSAIRYDPVMHEDERLRILPRRSDAGA